MTDTLNWNFFSETYHLKNDKYVQDVALLQRLQRTDCYPVILYPELLCEQLAKKFLIGSVGVGKDKSHIFAGLMSTLPSFSLNVSANSLLLHILRKVRVLIRILTTVLPLTDNSSTIR